MFHLIVYDQKSKKSQSVRVAMLEGDRRFLIISNKLPVLLIYINRYIYLQNGKNLGLWLYYP